MIMGRNYISPLFFLQAAKFLRQDQLAHCSLPTAHCPLPYTMWLRLTSLAAILTAASGMCFGTSSMQQSLVCPDSMVYYPQLCICVEPRRKPRLYDHIGYLREAPNMLERSAVYPLSPAQAYRQKLLALRHRLTASLPDAGLYSFDSSASSVAASRPSLLHPSRFHHMQERLLHTAKNVASVTNHVPRSWKIGGLQEYWHHGNVQPGLLSAKPAQWIPTLSSTNQVQRLPLLKRLHQMREIWRKAVLQQARRRLGDTALAHRYYANLPTNGISPDTSRTHHKEAGNGVAPDSPRGQIYTDSSKSSSKKPLLKLKDAALVKQGLTANMPDRLARRANSFVRSAMRLRATQKT
ncbi:hypothetical protein PoB_005218700 [Plakobranchus ocellatus]|uniref:Uncharacterized protein n=1 Tax=Plakobranchus ocellatus TaxID=259542 RepID=A0AAV4C348_9GAST|nr:hypothetical protein PoB_005218700 [Plakobranchus ocellatus]